MEISNCNNLSGKTIHDFTLLECLGCGAMGCVYRAIQNSLEREVAIKIILLNSPSTESHESKERLHREAKLSASLVHPNIVAVYAAGRFEEIFYIVMEYVKGESLQKKLTSIGRFPEFVSWEIGLQICKALDAAYSKGIIHRDVKPANILIDEKNVVKLTDFGLSKKNNDTLLTHPGTILGTPSYMSPEQAAGANVDFRADIYSLGATIYHLITGNYLFSGEDILNIMYKHRYESPVPPSIHIPGLQPETEKILLKMIEKKPEDRYQTYTELQLAIEKLLEKKNIVSQETTGSFITKRLLSIKQLFQRSKDDSQIKKTEISQAIKSLEKKENTSSQVSKKTSLIATSEKVQEIQHKPDLIQKDNLEPTILFDEKSSQQETIDFSSCPQSESIPSEKSTCKLPIWHVLICHHVVVEGEKIAQELNNTGRFMAVSVLQENDVVMLLEIELFHLFIYQFNKESNDIFFHENLSKNFPNLYQIVIDSQLEKTIFFNKDEKIAFIRKFDISTILQIVQDWQIS